MNKVFLIGRLTRNPEEETTKSGVNYAQFDLAVDRQYSGDEKVTDFNKEIAGHGEIVVHKGKKVHVKVVFE